MLKIIFTIVTAQKYYPNNFYCTDILSNVLNIYQEKMRILDHLQKKQPKFVVPSQPAFLLLASSLLFPDTYKLLHNQHNNQVQAPA